MILRLLTLGGIALVLLAVHREREEMRQFRDQLKASGVPEDEAIKIVHRVFSEE